MITPDIPILLDAGSGGGASRRLIAEVFLALLDNPILRTGDDAARLDPAPGPLAVSTDGHTVHPLFFPGGDIGRLAVYGTVNDVAMLGARPRWLTAAFIIEEGLSTQLLMRVVSSMAQAARETGVLVVAGDTKVVPRGTCDQLFITTTGVGEMLADPAPSGSRACPGDVILLSGPVGAHGLAVLGQRQKLSFLSGIESDCGPVHQLVLALLRQVELADRPGGIHVLRDPTRGGLATTVNEIAEQSRVQCVLDETAIPVADAVRDGCSVLGLDPLYLANEGRLVCVLPEALAAQALTILRAAHPDAARIGVVQEPATGLPAPVLLRTALGGLRVLPVLEGDPLPRIC